MTSCCWSWCECKQRSRIFLVSGKADDFILVFNDPVIQLVFLLVVQLTLTYSKALDLFGGRGGGGGGGVDRKE